MMSILKSFILSELYTVLKKLGQGTFACVYSAIDNEKQQMVAIKQIYVQRALLDEAMEEINKLSNLLNDHIISYKNSFYDSSEFHLNMVMQLCQDSLRGQMLDRKIFQTKQLQSFLLQMTCAFLQLERQNVMHLDLKPQNILVVNNQGSHYKLCDFGCSQISNISKMSGYEVAAFGTFNYLAPEIHVNYQGKKTRNSADVWSLGVTLYEMIFWRLPFSKDQNGIIQRKDVQDYFLKNNYKISYQARPDAPMEIIQIIKLMLKPIPTERITWKQLQEYLIKQLNIERHEFLDISILINHFNKIFDLLVKTAKLLKQGAQGQSIAFWKQEKRAATEIYEEFVHYIYIVGMKFQQKSAYKWSIIPKLERVTAQNLLSQAKEMQRSVCLKKQIKQFDSSDFNYQECVVLDQMKFFKQKIEGQGKLKGQLEFLHSIFGSLISIIQKSEGVFLKLESFESCFKLKS